MFIKNTCLSIEDHSPQRDKTQQNCRKHCEFEDDRDIDPRKARIRSTLPFRSSKG